MFSNHIIISNAFSLSMLPKNHGTHQVVIQPISSERAANILNDSNFVSAIGHEDTAKLLTNILNVEIPMNRISIELDHETELIVAQYNGPRLQEGTTVLPEGASIDFYFVFLPRHHGACTPDSNKTYEEMGA